jgi:hypothetical protein
MKAFDLDSPYVPLTPEQKQAEREKRKAEAEQRRKERAIAAQDKRFAERERIKKEAAELQERKQPESKMLRLWETNWSAISDEEKQQISAQNRECLLNWAMIDDAVHNIEAGVQSAPFPAETFHELQQFLATNPPVDEYPDLTVAANLDAETFESFADKSFVRTGRITRLPVVIWTEFCRRILDWSRNNPDQIDSEVIQKLEQIVTTNVPKGGSKWH